MSIIRIRHRRGALLTVALTTALALFVAGCHTEPRGGGETELSPGDLGGYWVAQLSDGGDELYGLGLAEANGPNSIRFELELSDHRTATLSGMVTGAGELTGQWRLGGAAAVTVRVGLLGPVGSALVVTSEEGEQLLVLHPVSSFEQHDIGAYSRAGDGATVIFAHDLGLAGTTGSFSVLDDDGLWPEDYRYRGYIWEGDEPILSDIGITAARFDDGAQIYTCLYDWNNDQDVCDVLTRLPDSPEQAELGGVWLGKEKRYDNLPEWFFAVVVAHGGALYIHERDETLLDSLFLPELRAVYDAQTGEYVDTDQGTSVGEDWRGRLSPDGALLVGEYKDGDPATRRFHSLQRIVQPPEGYLSGDASTLSVDWFDAPGGYPEPILGNATIVQDGSQLTVVDVSDYGATYQIDAQWTGYQYEGHWYDITAPELTSPWRGQLTTDGWYLHGTWDKGEYSLSYLPFVDPTAVSYSANRVVVSSDPYYDELFYAVSPIDGAALVAKRSQDAITSLRVLSPTDGVIEVALDERLRPTRIDIVDQSMTLTLRWRDDATTADATIVDGSGTTTLSIPVDLSSAQMLSLLSSVETDHGVDLSEARDWISANPDRLEQTYFGNAPAPSARILDPGLTSFLKENPIWNDGVTDLRLQVAMGIGGFLVAVGTVAGLAAITGVGLGLIVIVGAIWLLLNLTAWLKSQVCNPCLLTCFIGCL